MHSELEILRHSTNNETGNLIKKIQTLENESSTLKNLLKEAQTELSLSSVQDQVQTKSQDKYIETLMQEITSLKAVINTKTDTSVASNTREQQEIEALKAKLSEQEMNSLKEKYNSEIEHLKAKNAELNNLYEAEMVEKNARVMTLQGEIDNMKSTLINSNENIKVLQLQVASSNETQQSKNESETENLKLKERIIVLETEVEKTKNEYQHKLTDLTQSHENKIKENELKYSKEKEETMDACAQEIESVEKAKSAEIAILLLTKQTLESQLASSTSNAKNLSALIQRIAMEASLIRQQLIYVSGATKQDLENLSSSLRLFISQQTKARMKASEEALKVITMRYRKETADRKKLHNIIQELKGNIRVFMRCRPPSAKEIETDSSCITFPEPQQVCVFNSEKNKEKIWEFDEVFSFDSKQQQIFEEVSGLVTSVLDGYNVCIFAYGQTGSGKTYTMQGPPGDRGVNTRSLDELFIRCAARSEDFKDVVNVNVLEVYNEDIHDLLVDGGGGKLEVKQGPNGNHVPGLTTIQVENLDNVLELLAIADKNRFSRTTNMNEHSSRSHMMLSVTVTSESLVTGAATRGRLNLVDLAGSERINKSGATGQALKEAQNINKSLSALGDVIAARVAKNSHIPFRNSTLTYLLQDSLSQDSKTLMIVCTSPVLSSAEETFCSLNFAARVRTVELGKVSKNTVAAAPAASGGAAGNRLVKPRVTGATQGFVPKSSVN